MRFEGKKIAVCGCGWLGETLADRLLDAGATVLGTTTTEEKQQRLSEKGIEAHVVNLPAAQPRFSEFDAMVINIPPRRQSLSGEAFMTSIQMLSDAAKQAGCQRVVFISTTSVYGAVAGVVTESTPCEPNTDSGKAHLMAEKQLLAAWGEQVVVIRMSGLIGGERHPVKHLVRKAEISQGGQPVNLIEREDAVTAIINALLGAGSGEVLHLASADHPSRREYYTRKAAELGLPTPNFIDDEGRGAKVIDATYSVAQLGLSLQSL
ncbi:NAD-dependent epimerase/dehydratase family protein [Thaumasiovibrio subtropicus]|uniref:NAD-dependent epimerase/dehydratase family protein n=1 Tax=Thaumasiovibrio subtropicus TaxID=1891207 RepID=UPI000B35B6F0|nr:NAD-dependent epimerase/dehydratase family protein [Thaumasiovibrio subtropicus]